MAAAPYRSAGASPPAAHPPEPARTRPTLAGRPPRPPRPGPRGRPDRRRSPAARGVAEADRSASTSRAPGPPRESCGPRRSARRSQRHPRRRRTRRARPATPSQRRSPASRPVGRAEYPDWQPPRAWRGGRRRGCGASSTDRTTAGRRRYMAIPTLAAWQLTTTRARTHRPSGERRGRRRRGIRCSSVTRSCVSGPRRGRTRP